MATTRTQHTVKRMHFRSPHTPAAFNGVFNCFAGGIQPNPPSKGVRISGFDIVEYVPNSGLNDGHLTFDIGAFVHADTSGSYRGLQVEENAQITIDGTDVAAHGVAGLALTLYGWVNDPSVNGANRDAFFKVAATGSPPVSHAVPLWSTLNGDLEGAYHWSPEGGVGLIDLNTRIDDIVSAGGTTRDFVFTAQNYHAVHSEYQFMAFQDFGGVLGENGIWLPIAGDNPKYDTDNRVLKRGTVVTESAPFEAALFDQATLGDPPLGSYFKLAGARAVWLERVYSGDVLQPDPVFDGTVSIVDELDATVLSFSGQAEHDVDKELSLVVDLAPPKALRIRVEPSDPANSLFMRCIVLLRVVE